MMASCRPFALPWHLEGQIYSDFGKANSNRHSFIKSAPSSGKQKGEIRNDISYKNRLEAYWDQKILGQLGCKTGDLRENKGKLIERFNLE